MYKKSLFHAVEKGLGKFLTYEGAVKMSSSLNLPLAPPITSSVQITMECNSRCSYCDVWKLKDPPKAIPLETLDRIFSSLRTLGVRIVSVTGGEPLMRKDLDGVLRSAKRHRLLSHVVTNGISLTKDRAVELAEAGLDYILLSLDSFDPEIYEKHRGVPFELAERALTSLSNLVNEYPRMGGGVNCVITRHNIGKLVPFVKRVAEFGEGKIGVYLQSYHSPLSFAELSQRLDQEMMSKLKTLGPDPSERMIDNVPRYDLKPILENEIEQLIQLKKDGLPLNNSETYLRSIPDFLFDKKLPNGFVCLAGYTGIVIRYNLKVLLCWRSLPVGDLHEKKLCDIWYSSGCMKQRVNMKRLKCPRCMLPCHNEPAWYEGYNLIYKSPEYVNR